LTRGAAGLIFGRVFDQISNSNDYRRFTRGHYCLISLPSKSQRISLLSVSVTLIILMSAEKIKKQEFNLKPLTGRATTAPEIWAVVLAA
jgi:hypothetical protein